MRNKIFQPEKYDMVACPRCMGKGYVINPKRQRCPKCEGFGFIKMETEKEENPSSKK